VECWDALRASDRFSSLSSRSQAILKKVLTGNSGIATRHFVMENLSEAFQFGPDVLHARFSRHAPKLASEAASRALADAAIEPRSVDAVVASTCTGYLCPGLTSYLTELLGLRADVFPLDLVGQGCGAALPNLRAAEALLAAGRCATVLSVCVEVCSAAFFLDDDAGVLISACLFGDGAGAAVLSGSPNGRRRVEWRRGGSVTEWADRDLLRFEQKAGMLRNILSPQVPALAAERVDAVLRQVLSQCGVARSEIRGWIFHPGGRDVLAALRDKLGLDGAALRWSEAVLRDHGNLSSASVFFVLQSALADSAPDGYWWMSSFGAGFSAHGALLSVG
jgi:alkylresorcinol/alkylpyrone synthase